MFARHALETAQPAAPRSPVPAGSSGWAWRWTGYAAWQLSGPIVAVAALTVALDVATAWFDLSGPTLGRVAVSPALPLAFVFVAMLGTHRIGISGSALRAASAVVIGLGTLALILSIAHTTGHGGAAETMGLWCAAVGEELVFRVAAVVVVGAGAARLRGRPWRAVDQWGDGVAGVAVLGAAVVFLALPGHMAQAGDLLGVAPFLSLAVLLGYLVLRTGTVVPAILAHLSIDVLALGALDGGIPEATRAPLAAAVLVAVVAGALVTGRRLGLRRLVPRVVDLREPFPS